MFVKDLLGGLAGCLSPDWPGDCFGFLESVLRLPEAVLPFFLSTQESLNRNCASFIEQKNVFLRHFGDYTVELRQKTNGFSRQARELGHSLRVLVWKVFEKLTKSLFRLLAGDCRSTASLVKFLNVCGGFYPFTQVQADSLMAQLAPKLKARSDETPEQKECFKLCQSYNFFLLKKTHERRFVSDSALASILADTPRVEASEPSQEQQRKHKRKKPRKRHREKRAHRKRERSPMQSPLRKRSDGEFKSSSERSSEKKHLPDKQVIRERLQNKLRQLRGNSKGA